MDFTGKIALAPMAGICDLPFRLLCKEMGCDIVYTEMVSAKGMYYNNKYGTAAYDKTGGSANWRADLWQ